MLKKLLVVGVLLVVSTAVYVLWPSRTYMTVDGFKWAQDGRLVCSDGTHVQVKYGLKFIPDRAALESQRSLDVQAEDSDFPLVWTADDTTQVVFSYRNGKELWRARIL